MYAFYSDGQVTIKAYTDGSDWQLIDSNKKERWFSIWQNNVNESLLNAFSKYLSKEIKASEINKVS